MVLITIVLAFVFLVCVVALVAILYFVGREVWMMTSCIWEGTWWSARSRAQHYRFLRTEVWNNKHYRTGYEMYQQFDLRHDPE